MEGENLLHNIQRAVTAMHGCRCSHVGTFFVHEMMEDPAKWKGAVEIFDLEGHPKAERAFAWAWDDHGKRCYVAILAVPPITSPREAVQAAKKERIKAHLLTICEHARQDFTLSYVVNRVIHERPAMIHEFAQA
jgi:hypothetical protein